MDPIYSIYRITSPSNGVYIGVTRRPVKVRLKQHRQDVKNGSDLPIHRALRKYGKECVIDVILTAVGKELADKYERGIIAYYRSLGGTCYNLADGGQGGAAHRQPHSEETKLKISKAKRGCAGPNLGRKFGVEYCEKMRQAKLNKKLPKKWKQVRDSNGVVYASVIAAADAHQVSRTSITNILTNRAKALRSGVTFSYELRSLP